MSYNVLILGAGLVSRPLVKYLLDHPTFSVTMASRTIQKAEKIIDNHPYGTAIELNVDDNVLLEKLISNSDIVVSLLPYNYHVKVAKFCIKHSKHLVTTSYVSKDMKLLDTDAKNAGIIILNECGLDPGIDHMSAMQVIHEIEKNKGKVISFKSSTGALPSFEANNNPFGYKFSWSPRGVLLASRNSARWLENGKEINVPGEKLFENYYLQDIPDVGTFENYPNRDSIPYKDIYGLKDAETVYRGTYRFPGWCETMRKIVEIGWLNDKSPQGFNGKTYGELTKYLIGLKEKIDLKSATAKFLGLNDYSAVIKRLQWLGLFGDTKLPENKDNPLDYLNVLTFKKMTLEKNERDMIVMHHEFIAQYPSNKEYITSTLVGYGIPFGDSIISRTVALPAAIAVKLIIQRQIDLTGVHIPVLPDIYNPILHELREMGIKFYETSEKI
ncbi:saccharopine dehydrogenase [Thermoplasmatales archaeon SG8-52-4]|nr:MAG: saccharopine dehydrogenase [Thermoplasmatales archaeon SG8-52-4]